jgi:hypothetical protein
MAGNYHSAGPIAGSFGEFDVASPLPRLEEPSRVWLTYNFAVS